METLRTTHPPSYEAANWLRANKHLFKKTVYEPMIVCVSSPDIKLFLFYSSNDYLCLTYEYYLLAALVLLCAVQVSQVVSFTFLVSIVIFLPPTLISGILVYMVLK